MTSFEVLVVRPKQRWRGAGWSIHKMRGGKPCMGSSGPERIKNGGSKKKRRGWEDVHRGSPRSGVGTEKKKGRGLRNLVRGDEGASQVRRNSNSLISGI